MPSNTDKRFDALLEAMVSGEASSAERQYQFGKHRLRIVSPVVAKSKLTEILRETLHADVNVRPVDAALH